MDTNKHESKHQTFPFQFWIFEIQYYSDAKPCDAQIIQHLASLQIGYAVNCFGVHNHSVERD